MFRIARRWMPALVLPFLAAAGAAASETETFHQLQQRGLEAIKTIVEQCCGQEVLVVSHGAILKAVLSFYARRPLSDLWAAPAMHNCAHSIVEFDTDKNPTIVRFCDLDNW